MTTKRSFRFSRLVFFLVLVFLWSGCGGKGSSSGRSGETGGATLNVVYTYDELNRLTHVHYSTGVVVSYTYDAAGNILSADVVH